MPNVVDGKRLLYPIRAIDDVARKLNSSIQDQCLDGGVVALSPGLDEGADGGFGAEVEGYVYDVGLFKGLLNFGS